MSELAMDVKEAMNTSQRVVALDARYNTRRPLSNQHRMLYIRRRNQLLQDNAKHTQDSSIRETYLKQRSTILSRKYGSLKKSRSGSSRISSAKHSLRQSMESLPIQPLAENSSSIRRNSSFLSTGVVPTKAADASRALAGDATLSEHYAFCGMQHIFDKHTDAIRAISFANDDKTMLASASMDGTLSVFSLVSEPPSLSCTLRGHTRPVNDLDWSAANDFIASASSDGTSRVWNSRSGSCLRVFADAAGARTLCCRFPPNNNNLLVITNQVGNSKGQVKAFNVSTGKLVKGSVSKVAGAVYCLTFEPTGSHIWAGDNKGSMYQFELDKVTWKLQRLKRLVVSQGCMVTSISYRTWISREARDPSLLVSCADSTLRLYRILPDGNLYLKRKFPLPHTKQPLRSAFCPLMSFLQGACVVSGGEDGSVYFFDVESGTLVNKLQGHSNPVLCVCWTYDESLLASCDTEGTVIIWKREQKGSPAVGSKLGI